VPKTPRISRKHLVAEWLAAFGGPCVSEPDLRELRQYLAGALPDKHPPALPRLAEIVFEAGARVRFGEYGGGDEDRLLSLDTLESVEAGLRRLHDYLTRAQQAGDIAGVERARMTARRVRRRALWIAHNQRVAQPKRLVKQEMADWLLLWLEMPDAFFEWLILRKRTPDYQQIMHGARDSA
jgi:hypothetical protein